MLGSRAQRHRRVHAELSRFIRRRRDYAALVTLATDHHSLALERGIEQFFHRDKEGVHVDVKDGFAGRGHKGTEGKLEGLYQRDSRGLSFLKNSRRRESLP